jgi:hypothetical protein
MLILCYFWLDVSFFMCMRFVRNFFEYSVMFICSQGSLCISLYLSVCVCLCVCVGGCVGASFGESVSASSSD